jgi:hypothetical protein
MGGDGQYGQAFYLFARLDHARTFASAEQTRGAVSRRVIAEVLLPAEHFDRLGIRQVPRSLDWGMTYRDGHPRRDRMRDLRSGSKALGGAWTPSRARHVRDGEAFYELLNGAPQIGILDVSLSSILHGALIRRLEIHSLGSEDPVPR